MCIGLVSVTLETRKTAVSIILECRESASRNQIVAYDIWNIYEEQFDFGIMIK